MNREFYTEKPTAYLDQNILDLFTSSNDYIKFFNILKSEFKTVYSDETLRETQRSGENNSNKFLNILKELDAFYIQITYRQSDFEVTLCNKDPFDVYHEYCKNDLEYRDIFNSLLQTFFKFSGGRSSENFSEIINEQKLEFNNFIKEVSNELTELKEELPEIESIFQSLQDGCRLINNCFEESANEFEKIMDTHKCPLKSKRVFSTKTL